jgi:GTP-binding protein Era
VALIGAPNAGKSTLLNALVGSKLAIVTHKVQTTRALLRGIVVHRGAQIVFVDTPGIFAPKRRIERAMVDTAWGGAADADVVALLLDARRGLTEEDAAILERLAELPAQREKVLILNKVDVVTPRSRLLTLSAEANERVRFSHTFMVSALTGDGVADLLDHFAERMPEGPFLFPEDEMTDLPLRFLAAEITREALMLRLHDELPYRSTVETDRWVAKRDGIRIEQTIYVERDSQRKIVLGRGGETIKAISTAARLEIAKMVEQPVHLFLFVKVRENWAEDPERYRQMGIAFHK